MKGKGKKGRDSSEDECPLQFLDFEPLDVVRFCPRFTQIAGRTEDEGVGIEDLDALQSEVESMLVNVTRRSIAIESEIDALISWQESQIKPKKGSSSPSKGSSETTSKRKLSSRGRDEAEERTSKRSRLDAAGLKAGDSSSCSSTSSSVSTASSASSSASSSATTPASKSQSQVAKDSKVKSKSKNLTSKSQQQYDDMYQPKNDIPDRFWAFIEPYCTPVKQENVKLLDDMIKSYEDDSLNEYYKIPNRGKHYSTKWATTEGSESVTTTGSASKVGKEKADKKKGAATPSGGAAAAGAKGGKKNQNRDGNKSDEKGSYGVLTQRLIQSLLEDSSTGSPDSPLSDAASNGNAEAGGLNGSGQIWKQVSTGNTAQIEKKIRKELQEHGLIELEEPETGSVASGAAAAAGSAEDDEILRELVRCQNELKMVASTNCSQLKSLLSLVKTDLQRQEIEKKLSEVDEEVIDGYKKLMQAKSKKRNITKKEKESCLKSLKERDELVLQLEGLQTFPFAAEVL